MSVKFSPPRGDRWALYDALADIASQSHPKSYFEIGVSRGESLEVVLSNCTPDHLTLCDEWGSESGGQSLKSHAHITELLNRLGYWGEVKYLDGSSHDLLPRQFFGRQYDLITVDGDHSEDGARSDLNDCWPLLASGGYIVFDDIAPDFFHPYLLDVWDHYVETTNVVEVYRCLVDKFGEHTLSHGVVVGRKA